MYSNKICVKPLKKHAVHNIHRLAGAPMFVGPTGSAQCDHALR